MGEEFGFAKINPRQWPAPSRPRKPTVGVVMNDTAKEGHDAMLRNNRSDSRLTDPRRNAHRNFEARAEPGEDRTLGPAGASRVLARRR